jgi:hypothetical protein
MFRSTILFLTLLALPLHANLGETVKECVTRYGGPVSYTEANPKFPFGTVTFSASGLTLVIFLIGEKEVGAKVFKTDKSALSDAERDSIMGADTAGSQWKSVPSADPSTLEWTRSDKATAIYDKEKNVLIFTSDEMAKAVAAAAAAGPSPETPATPPPPAKLPLPPLPDMSPPDKASPNQ